MKKLLTLSLTIALTACNRYACPPASVETKDSLVTTIETIVKDTMIYIPGQAIAIHDTIPCPQVKYDNEVKSKNGKLRAQVTIYKGKLEVACMADSLQQRIEWLEKQKIMVQTRREVKMVQVPVNIKQPYIPKWVWWLLVANILYIAWRLRNPIGIFIKHITQKW